MITGRTVTAKGSPFSGNGGIPSISLSFKSDIAQSSKINLIWVIHFKQLNANSVTKIRYSDCSKVVHSKEHWRPVLYWCHQL